MKHQVNERVKLWFWLQICKIKYEKANCSSFQCTIKIHLDWIIALLTLYQYVLIKQPKEEEMTEEEKAAQKARPIATNPIPGTPW